VGSELLGHTVAGLHLEVDVKNQKKWLRPSSIVVALCAGVGIVGCGANADDQTSDLVDTNSDKLAGDHLAGISTTDFNAAKDNFAQVENVNDGVGPVFNEVACGNCHSLGAVGGAGVQIERRFGRFDNGAFNPLANEGGSLRQLRTLGNFNNPAFHGGPAGNPTLCQVPLEAEPADATVHNVGRNTTPLFGLGLVDSMPDSFFDAIAAAEPAATRGVVNRVSILLPDVQDPGQRVGGTRVARFGLKAGVPTLQQFAADAYVNEMGITTQSCVSGQSITAFCTESAPNGRAQPVGCDDLAPLQASNFQSQTGCPINTDDAVGSCAGGVTEIQDDIANFFTFMTFLAPAGTDNSDPSAASQGKPLFTSTGCANCHVDSAVSTGSLATAATFRTPGSPPTGVPGNFVFHPFSDFLAHDMGTLGDNIGNAGDSTATTRRMRTAPLWGIRFKGKLLHDGRASDVATAIAGHAGGSQGQGTAAANAFNALSSTQKHNLVQYVRSL
jgi:CxxC motif-containing protein (DUF1111 family)